MTNHTAIVTGASRGIGQAIAIQLASAGFSVIGTATSDSGADNITAYLADANASGVGMKLNVTEPESIVHVIARTSSEFGVPSVLINNAGITQDNLLIRMKDSEWDKIIDTNLTSIFRMSKACLRGMMKARYGRIINITSVVGATGNPGQANYAAAKAGIIGFSKSLAREVGTRNITVNSVAPGFIDTDMTRSLPEDHKKNLTNSIPMARLGTAEEVAHAVAFLASPEAAYITGETLHVNGGMYMV